jgi:mono/diheme cytochrome c family protein
MTLSSHGDFTAVKRHATFLLVVVALAASPCAADPPREKWVAPGTEWGKPNPIPKTPESVRAGLRVFTNNCVSCHGTGARGDGLLVPSLPVKPADLTNPDVWRQPDSAIFWKISTGRQPMPTWDPVLTTEERWCVINYLRMTFAPKSVNGRPQLAASADSGASTSQPATGPAVARQDQIEDLQQQVFSLNRELHRTLPGTEGFFVAGDAFVGFSAIHGSTSTFSAGVAPLVLWKPTQNLVFEASVDLGFDSNPDGTSSTSVNLTIADAAVLVTDWLTVGGGVFVTPFGVYHNHFDPPWINKFADDPLPFGDNGIAPRSSLGIYARGGELIGNSKIVYDLYVINGPTLITTDKTSAGSLDFDNFIDTNNDKAVGGRLGFIPIPNMEVGYSAMYGRVNPTGFPSTRAFLQAFDLNFRPDVPALGGVLDFRTEWVWSNVSQATFDPTGSLGFGPLTFANYRDGGYVQLCFRPVHSTIEVIRNLELCGRWDYLRTPMAAPGGGTEQRFTIGLDYWLNPQAVLKLDYEFDRRSASLGSAQNALLLQFGIGL